MVDDYERLLTTLGGPLGSLLELLGASGDIGLHVLLARRVAGAQRTAFEPFGQRLREVATVTIVMSGSPDEGPLLSGVTPRPLPPGRGTLVTAGRHPQLVQCCLDVATACDAPLRPDGEARLSAAGPVTRQAFSGAKSVNAPRVLLLTVRGPEGQVDVAARGSVSVSELVATVAETLGETVVVTTDSSDRRPEPSPSRERHVAKSATLAQAGLLDGHVLTVVSPTSSR